MPRLCSKAWKRGSRKTHFSFKIQLRVSEVMPLGPSPEAGLGAPPLCAHTSVTHRHYCWFAYLRNLGLEIQGSVLPFSVPAGHMAVAQ